MIWDYFCFSDADPRYSKVNFNGITKFTIWLYYRNDFTCDTAGPCYSYNLCRDYAFYSGGSWLYLGMKDRTPEEVANWGFAHELQHLCYKANDLAFPFWDYANIDETLSTDAEHMRFAFEWSVNSDYDQSFDSSIYSADRCEPTSEYDVWRLWTAYLDDHTAGPTSATTDDAVYRWVRAQVNGESEVSMNTLADVLADSAYARFGGGSGDERLQSLFQYFAVAKFANAPNFGTDNRYGYENGYSPVDHAGFFQDLSSYFCSQSPVPDLPVDCYPNAVCDTIGAWNVRVLPPEYSLAQGQENSMTTVSGIYTAPDGSRDYVQVSTYGTDYLIFRAGSYFQDGAQHDLRISLDGAQSTPPTNTEMKVWIIGYDSVVSLLQKHPEDIVFIEPVPVPATSTAADIVVTDFGRSVKSVVVVVTLVETTASTTYASPGVSNMKYFNYTYGYGVYSPASANVSWQGSAFVAADRTVPASKVLTVDPGTIIRIATSDASATGADTTRIEINVEGTLVADGTAASPIVFESWNPQTTEDWVGFYFDSQSGGGTFDHCVVGHARTAVQANAPLTITNTTIEHIDRVALSVAGGDSVYANNLTIRDVGFMGINALQGMRVRLSHSNLSELGDYGVRAYSGAQLYVDNTTIRDADLEAISVSDVGTYAKIEDSTIENNYRGLRTEDDAVMVVEGSTVDQSTNYGVYSLYDATVDIDGCTVKNADAAVAIYESNASLVGSLLRDSDVGLLSVQGSAPTVYHCDIIYNDTGVLAMQGGLPNLGSGGLYGNNELHHNTTYHVSNLTTPGTLMAENNYWKNGTFPYGPPASKINGLVDSYPALGSPPSPVSSQPADRPELPPAFALSPNYPNPFNPTTTVPFAVPNPGGKITLAIYNVRGQLVRTLIDGRLAAGYHSVTWDGTNNRGVALSSGIYFLRMRGPAFESTRKLVLLK